MRLISSVRGLTLVKTLVQIAAYALVMWTYADRQGLGDAFVDGLRALVGLPAQLLTGATSPGGDG
jgi:hypothetical protein